MVSKRQKVIGIVIGAMIILASGAFVLLNQHAPSLDTLLIHAEDIEPGWQELDRRSDSVIQVFENSTSSQRVVMIKNTTYYIVAYLYAFDLPEDCRNALNESRQTEWAAFALENIGIGGGGYLKKLRSDSPLPVLPVGNSTAVGLLGSNIAFGMVLSGGFELMNITAYAGERFTQDNILVYIDVLFLGPNYPSQAIMTGMITEIGSAQLDRLDYYLGG